MALSPWVRPIAYCENDRHAQSVLLSRQADGHLPLAPIWEDVRTFPSGDLNGIVDIIYGGFPCQDISCARTGKGLAGERSGLVFEIFRLADELRPTFVFLENVPAIRTRGGERVGKELAIRGFDSRWTIVSAAEVGAPHLRKRWFLLAHSDRSPLRDFEQRRSGGWTGGVSTEGEAISLHDGGQESLADPLRIGREKRGAGEEVRGRSPHAIGGSSCFDSGWWAVEPNVGRVAHGVPLRVDRLRGLGNAVVPLQAREAFKKLMGLT